jgi:hypothetical protein
MNQQDRRCFLLVPSVRRCRLSGTYYLINIADFAQFDRICKSPWGHLLLAIVNDKPDYRERTAKELRDRRCAPTREKAIP